MGIIFIEIFLVGLTILFFILEEKTHYDFQNLALAMLAISLFGVLLTMLIISQPAIDKNLIIKTEITITKLIPVNNYYLYKGDFVKENNERGTNGDMTIKVSDLSPNVKIYLNKTTEYKKQNFWHFARNSTTETLEIKEGI